MSEKYFECQICFSGRTSFLTLSTRTSASHTASPQICHGSSPSQGNDTHTSRDTIMSEIMCHTIYFKWQKYVWSLVRMSDLQSDTPSMYTSHGVSYCVYCVCHVYVMTELPRLLRMSDLLCYLSSNVRFSFLRCLPNYVTWGTYSTYSAYGACGTCSAVYNCSANLGNTEKTFYWWSVLFFCLLCFDLFCSHLYPSDS